MKEIFSTGIVRPAKGDFGVSVVALFMLFYGNLLQKTINNTAKSKKKDRLDYDQFSVSLDDWLDLLRSGGRTREGKMLADSQSGECPSVSVGFIQVCQNRMRSYCTSWESLGAPKSF